MPSIIPEDYALCRMLFTLSDKSNVMSVAFGHDNTTSDLSPASIADGVYEAMTVVDSPFGSLADVSDQYGFDGVEVSLMTSTGPLLGSHIEPKQGTSSSIAPVPVNSALLITKATARGGRKGKGRMFVPPWYPQEAAVSANGFIGSGIVTTLQGKWDKFLTTLATGDIVPVLFHSDIAVSPSPITQLIVQNQLATQRRRMR